VEGASRAAKKTCFSAKPRLPGAAKWLDACSQVCSGPSLLYGQLYPSTALKDRTQVRDIDRYGRTVAQPGNGPRGDGLVCHQLRTARCGAGRLEAEAKTAKRGLWCQPTGPRRSRQGVNLNLSFIPRAPFAFSKASTHMAFSGSSFDGTSPIGLPEQTMAVATISRPWQTR
jgi:hypothetical protein